jgi:hypothetical protein
MGATCKRGLGRYDPTCKHLSLLIGAPPATQGPPPMRLTFSRTSSNASTWRELAVLARPRGVTHPGSTPRAATSAPGAAHDRLPLPTPRRTDRAAGGPAGGEKRMRWWARAIGSAPDAPCQSTRMRHSYDCCHSPLLLQAAGIAAGLGECAALAVFAAPPARRTFEVHNGIRQRRHKELPPLLVLLAWGSRRSQSCIGSVKLAARSRARAVGASVWCTGCSPARQQGQEQARAAPA